MRIGRPRVRTIPERFSTSPTVRQKVWVLQRDTLDVVSSVGAGGRWPGYFYGVGNIAVDSTGNLYTGETYEGKRLQKFVFKGVGRTEGGRP
jgi:hypothetical protein